MFSTTSPPLFPINFILVHNILYGHISWFSMVIYGINISTIINKSVKNVFYHISLKSILKKNFSFETFFHSDPTHHTIFFHVSCGCPKATFGHYWGESLANLVLITAFDTYSTWKSSGASKQGGCKGQAPTGVWTRTPLVLNVIPLPTRPLAWKLQK